MERFFPWDNLGCDVSTCANISEALKAAQVDWEVEAKPVFWQNNDGKDVKVKDSIAVVRKDNQEFVSEISSKSNIIQNVQAFDFLDTIVKKTGGVIERVGYRDKAVHAIVRLPEETILDDGVAPYLVVRNSFCGKGKPLEVFLSPYRLACANQLSDAISKSRNVFKSDFYIEDKERQSSTIESILRIKEKRMEHLEQQASIMATTKIAARDFENIVSQLFPTDAELDISKKKLAANEYATEQLYAAYDSEDLGNFKGTAWGVFNAVSDFATHAPSYKKIEKGFDTLPSEHLGEIENRIKLLVATRYILSHQYGLKLNY